MEWFSNLDFLSKFYWLIAFLASFVFIIVVILAFVGGDAGEIEDLDSDVDSDTGIGFQFITFKNLVGFFTIFGWSGVASIDAGLSKPLIFIISTFSGLLMMVVMAAMFYFMRKLTDSGTLKYKNAINAIGEVYLTIGANRSKMGKVTVRVQGALRELDALTDSFEPLKSGTIIKVVDVTNNGILIVDRTIKPIEPIKQKTYEITDGSSEL
ncbi:hypothetical protein [Flavisericum labens]|uniref:hypothetical protein n=1 Tax=Flavisericum labens TaxID=3377112 RepID=UPI00387AA4C0